MKLIPTPHAETITREAAGRDLGPLDEGRLFALLVEAGHEHREIAEWYGGKPVAYVHWRIELLNLCDLGTEWLDDGRLPLALAGYIARLSEPNQQLMLNRWIRGDFRHERHAERHAASIAEDEQGLYGL
ncbi:hypothetical protein [Streptomyces parvulus]|uniref:hypothetical protein n=1 Tax=Streptomyces parvulus TaxID=146923 RepID=UPI0037F8904A